MNLHRSPHQAGFALVATLLLLAVMSAVGVTYLRHAMLDSRTSNALQRRESAREAGSSSLQFAQQALASNSALGAKTVSTDHESATLQLATLSEDGRASVSISAVDEYGLGSTTLAEVGRVPVNAASHPDDLPRLTDTMLETILNDSSIPKHWLGGQQWIQDTDYEGVVVIQNSAGIFLDEVTIKGLVITEDAFTKDTVSVGDFGDQLPCLLLDGDVRIEPGDFLPGISVLMPDGVLRTWDHDESVIIRGDVSAHTVMLKGDGCLDGNIACVSQDISATMSLPGADRAPRDWGDGLDLGNAWTPSFLAVLPKFETLSDCQSMLDYSFPTK